MYIQTDSIAIHFQLRLLTNDNYRIENHKIQENIAVPQYFLQKGVVCVHFLVNLCPSIICPRGICATFRLNRLRDKQDRQTDRQTNIYYLDKQVNKQTKLTY